MLHFLHIENYVLIDSLDIDFSQGFSAITGQTGAGKSILIGALGMVLGNRADLKSISDGKDRCVIEAEFDISNYGLERFFEDNDLDYSPCCILRRELYRSGKSRIFMNDSPASASVLKQLGEKLIDIHSQHNNLLLKDNTFQTSVLDGAAHNKDLFSTYSTCYKTMRQKRKDLEKATETLNAAKSDFDYISYQYKQLTDAALKEDEEIELEEETSRLEHADDIASGLGGSAEAIDGENGVLSLLKTVENNLSRISRFDSRYEELRQRIESCRIDIKDVDEEINSSLGNVNTDPARLQTLRDRLDLLYGLMQKHKVKSCSELLHLQNEYKERIDRIETGDDQITALENALAQAEADCRKAASALSESRRNAIPELENTICAMLNSLGMPNARFVVDIQQCELSALGSDVIQFLFSSNKQNQPRPVAQIASGGEISRIMLCIKTLMAKSEKMPTMIFDEIDTGVSGEVAAKMGQIMKDISANTQVICISHLPQVACKADRQYMVYKTDDDNGNSTHVKLLDEKERVEEIAKMLSGENVSDAAIKNAQDLLGISA